MATGPAQKADRSTTLRPSKGLWVLCPSVGGCWLRLSYPLSWPSVGAGRSGASCVVLNWYGGRG